MEKFASNIARTKNHPFYINCKQSNAHTQEREMTQQFTNLLYHDYKTPLFTIETACCKMPTNIAGVYRNNLEKMLNFLDLVKTGVKGFVRDIQGRPLRNATLRVQGNNLLYSVTKNLGHFRLILPAGPITLEFYSDHYEQRVVPVKLNDGAILDLGDVILQRLSVDGKTSEPESSPTAIVKGIVSEIKSTDNPNSGSVSGLVLDTLNHPVKMAKVAVLQLNGNVLKEAVTDEIGAFIITNVPVGDHKLSVSANGKVPETSSLVHVTALMTSKGNVFHLETDEHVWGMPRLLFILVMGCMLVAMVGCVMFCIMTYQNKRKEFKNYSFSLLSQGKDRPLFEDEEEEEETDVYRAPIKSELHIHLTPDRLIIPVLIHFKNKSRHNHITMRRTSFTRIRMTMRTTRTF